MRYVYYNTTYILVFIGAILCLIASARVNITYAKYSKYKSTAGMTGADAAREILAANGIYDVSIAHVNGNLTDHYDPQTQTVNLSDATYASCSVAAIGVAAHECGHVLQNHTGYIPLKIRSALVPAANLGSNLGIPMVLIGLLLGNIFQSATGTISQLVCELGIALFCLAVLFQLVTLPVEFDASHRALTMLKQYNILSDKELPMSRKVLSAAAMTYVAAAASSILQLLRILLIVNGRSRRD